MKGLEKERGMLFGEEEGDDDFITPPVFTKRRKDVLRESDVDKEKGVGRESKEGSGALVGRKRGKGRGWMEEGKKRKVWSCFGEEGICCEGVEEVDERGLEGEADGGDDEAEEKCGKLEWAGGCGSGTGDTAVSIKKEVSEQDDDDKLVLDKLLSCVPDVGCASSDFVLKGKNDVNGNNSAKENTDAPEVKGEFGECPICGSKVLHANLQSHANNCLEVQESNKRMSSSSDTFEHNDAEEDSWFQVSKSTANKTALLKWLKAHEVAKYLNNFWENGFKSVDSLMEIKDELILKDTCKISAIGARRKLCIALGINERNTSPNRVRNYDVGRRERERSEQEERDLAEIERSETKVGGGTPGSGKEEKRDGVKLWKIFEKGYRAPSMTFKPKVKKRKSEYQQYSTPKQHPWNHRVPGTSMVVDSFRAAGTDACKQFFITHAHGDHYQTLRKGFKYGKVLCSATTAKLLKIILNLPDELLEIIPMNKPVNIQDAVNSSNGVTVTLFSANHCPGAVIMLFRVWSTGKFILHTGDCRFSLPIFSSYSPLQSLSSNKGLDYLFLDTTYCNPKYTFPDQAIILRQVALAAQKENQRTKGQCIYIFGSYTIGKERCFLRVAEDLELKIFCESYKRRLLKATQDEFGERIVKRLVAKPVEARVHVTTMRNLNVNNLKGYVRKHKLGGVLKKAGLAVVVRPTGWTFGGGGMMNGVGRKVRKEDGAICLSVAYSEHSSFNELREFVGWMRPKQIVPTVNVRCKADSDRLCSLLKQQWSY